MRVRFWGTRGSLPTALNAKQVLHKVANALRAANGQTFHSFEGALAFAAQLPFATAATYGGESSCVEILADHDDRQDVYVVCDAGSGLRRLGGHIMSQQRGKPAEIHIFMSHTHWDHIMGFPLFTPSYVPGMHIYIYGCHPNLEAAIRRQHGSPSFPVDFNHLGAHISFVTLTAGRRYDIANLGVQAFSQLHTGDSYGYRFDQAGKTLVYSTDAEHKMEGSAEVRRITDAFQGADLVICDTMYSLADAMSVKEDWGHSSNVIAVELCQLAGAKHLALFHHEPIHDDEQIDKILTETRRLEEITRDGRDPLTISAAYDGLEIAL